MSSRTVQSNTWPEPNVLLQKILEQPGSLLGWNLRLLHVRSLIKDDVYFMGECLARNSVIVMITIRISIITPIKGKSA